MLRKNNCKGTLYRISGKSYCVGEKTTTAKHGKSVKSRKLRKSSKSSKSSKSKKNRARGPGDNHYYDITQCCMCGKNVNVNSKNTLISLECLRKKGSAAHRICKKCWFKPHTGFATEGRSHKCPGCEKHLPFTNVKQKTLEVVDLTGLSD